MPEIKPLVSVVITTKNEEKNIESCLESIKGQTFPNIETIVVDNFSTDKTKEIISRYSVQFYSRGPERSAQRNFGMINKSQGQFVMFVDADMILSPDLIEACVEKMIQEKCVALHIREVVLGNTFWSKVRRFERSFYDGTAVDGARFFDRATFVATGGFDEELFRVGSGEDWDIDKLMKQHGTICLLTAGNKKPWKWAEPLNEFIKSRGVEPNPGFPAIYHNEADFNLVRYLKKKFYYAKGFDGYIKKWGKNDPDIQKQFGFYYRYFGVFLENGKWKTLVTHPLLGSGMYFLRVLVGFVFIIQKIQHK